MTAVKDTDKDTTSKAQNRFVVSLPADVGDMIDTVGKKLADELQKSTGVSFELSRAQIVQALVRQALKTNEPAEVAEKISDEAQKVAA